jgi:hypothetical protein
MLEMDRRSCLACLSAVELNLVELRGMPGWFQLIGLERRRALLEFVAWIRACEHELQTVQGLGVRAQSEAEREVTKL